mgnify:FL=1
MQPADSIWWPLRACIIAAVCLPAFGCHRDQVRLRVAEQSDRYEWHHPISPDTITRPARELLFQIDVPLGYARGHEQPLEGLPFNTRVRWNVLVRPLSDELARLAERHNRADITVAEFGTREAELLTALQRLAILRGRLEDTLRAYQRAKKVAGGDPEAPEPAGAGRRAEAFLERAEAVVQELVIRPDPQTNEASTGESNP